MKTKNKTEASSFRVVGKRVDRYDAVQKVTGEAQFVDDITLPGMLYGKLLRSPYPHARIKSVNTQNALKLTGVKAVATAEDVPNRRFHWMTKDRTVFARDKVRYIGEPMAAVAAVEKEVAEEAVDLIEVAYEELPALFDPEEAMKSDAPLIHEEIESYQTLLPTHRKYGNVIGHYTFSRGDVEEGFQKADFVFEDEFSTQRQYPAYLETWGTLAVVDFSGKITVWQNTQTPFGDRKDLSIVFGMPLNKIRVVSPFVGGGFGGKANTMLAPYAVILSMKAKKPVKIINTRKEDILGGCSRHRSKIKVKTGVKKDGSIVARQFTIIYDTGAYAEEGPGVANMGLYFGMGPYNIPNLKMESLCVYTNNMISSALRGYGVPQPTFAGETQMDMIAERLKMDPFEIRQKNGLGEGDPHPVTGHRLRGVGYKETLKEARKCSKWGKETIAKNRGRGLASMIFYSGGMSSGAVVKVNEDATVQVFTGGVDLGQGALTVAAQIAAEVLGIPYEHVSVVSADTETTPFDTGTFGDTKTHDGGNAVKRAAEDARQQILEFASEMLEANINDLELSARKVSIRGRPDKAIPLIAVCMARHYEKGGPIIGRGSYKLPLDPSTKVWDIPVDGGAYHVENKAITFASQVAEVEVDVETGNVKVLSVVSAHDVGKAINPKLVEGQIEGGVVMGLGYALSEEILTIKGKTLNPNLHDYKVPTPLDIPRIEAVIVEEPGSEGPFGAKGVGEPAPIPVAPAIANAVYDAIGVRIKDLPITPDKIVEALKKRTKVKRVFNG